MGGRYMILVYLSILTALLLSEVSCDVGDACTATDVTTCGGDPVGAGYQCDNNLCKCNNDYYDASGNCTKKLGFEEICTSNTGCLSNLTCLSGKCGCDNTDYHDGNNTCIQKPGYEGTCTNTTGCLGNLTCLSNDTCGCDNSHYHKEDNCLQKPGYEDTCTSITGCLNNMTCSPDTGNGNCGCDDTYYHKENKCLQKPGFNGICNSTLGCLGNLTCLSNGKCGCDNTDYHDGNNNCLQKGGYGDPCTTTVDSCQVVNGSCYTDSGDSTCTCNDNFYTDNTECKPVAELKPGVTRDSLTSNSVTINWKVPVKDAIQSFNIKGNGPNIEKTQIDRTKRTVTITGLTPNTPYTNVKVETVVKTDRNPSLVVPSDQLNDFSTPKAGYKEQCDTTDQCDGTDTECVDIGGGKKCYCKEGFYWNNNNQCKNASELKTTFVGADPKTNSVTVTWTLPSNNQYISSISIEVNGIKNKTGIDKTATSSEITGLQPGTVYNIIVISIVNTDRYSNYEVKSEPVSTTTKQVSGSSCIPKVQPCTGNLQCINNICGCNSTHYLFMNFCYPKLEYNGDCSNSSQACIPDLICYAGTSKCKCKFGEYRSGNQCKPVSELNATDFRVTDSTDNSLSFTWNVLSDTYINGYVISGNSFQNTTFQNTARTGRVTGLSPGTDYTNIKITSRVRTDRGSIIDDAVSDQILSDSTNPGVPGPLDSNNDYNTTKEMIIRFGRPTGGVDNYSVEITGPGLSNPFKQQPTTNSITVPVNTLQSGRAYSISIIAVYKGKNSTEFTDSFNTESEGSGPVKDLNITNINSRTLTVSWSYPNEDMGALSAYILDVKIGNKCIQQIIYVTDNNKPMINTCANVTPIYNGPKDLKAGITQLITDLLPYINYTLIVTPYNEAGPGSVDSKSALTAIEAAGEPSNLNVTDIQATDFLVTWIKPRLKTGPTTYYLNVYEQEDLTNNQATRFFKKIAIQGYDTEEKQVTDVVSFWHYRVELQAHTEAGNSSVLNVSEFRTLSSAPGKVEGLLVDPTPGIFTTAKVSWSCIKEKNRHGIIMNYTLTSTLEGEGNKPIQHNNSCKFTKTVRVQPGRNTTFGVYATNEDFEGIKITTKYEAPTGKPILAKEENILLLNTAVIGKTSFSVTVCPSCLTDETNGPIKITALFVCVKGKCGIEKNPLELEDVQSFSNWKTASSNSFNSPYRVTNASWYGDQVVDEVKFVVGSESDCKNKPEGYFCNGPLNMDTEYQILAVSCTEGGCSVSQPLGSFKTEPEDTDIVTPIVVSIVVILVVVAVILAGVYLYKRRKEQDNADEHSIHSIDSIIAKPTTPRYRPIKLEHFEEQLANLQKDSNLLFSEEFEGIGELSPKHDSKAAQRDENKPKNRYVNILAFDHSRVKLLPIDDDETTDYINANYIPGYKSQREYIATQGPLITNVGGVDITTIPDFWRMIWEQRVAIIVMLSDLTEKGKPKVDKYWKDQGESEQYGDIIVEVTSVSVLNKYTIKIFELKLGEEVRKVRHFFLPGWEDYRANLQPEDVLEFLSVVRQEVKPIDKGPMVVHCSAGVGRTGTFIALDIFQQYINERDMSSDIDIYDLVLRMRNFRQHMVQSEKQYIFIHETIKEIINRRKKKLQDNDTAIYENTGYSNEAFVPDDIYQNVENGKPTTTL